MDKLPTETNRLLANTKLQILSQHLFAVGFVAYRLLDLLHVNNDNIKRSTFIAGILHDVGKIDPEFQRWVNKKIRKAPDNFVPEDGVHIDSPAKFSFVKHPRHHELSWVLAEGLLEGCLLNKSQRSQVAHGIYWHHTKPFRKNDIFNNAKAIHEVFNESLLKNKFSDVYYKARLVLKDVQLLADKFNLLHYFPNFCKSFELTTNSVPLYKSYNNAVDDDIERYKNFVRDNALNNILRAAVISADRLVSACSAEDLEEYLSEGSLADLVEQKVIQEVNTLTNEIEDCLQGFEITYPNSVRNVKQSQAASSLANLKKFAEINNTANIGVLQGPAGCGKTKITLEWALKTKAEKIIWVCPRVQVCLGLLHDLATKEYLPNSRIEIFTGEYKKILSRGISFNTADDTDESEYFSGDIVITTIDQIVNSIRSHSDVDTFIKFLAAHVVFDEFHEFVNMTAFNLLFAELIEAKKQQGENADTLLVSATPHYFYLTEFLGIKDKDIVTINSFNNSDYQIEFVSYDEKEVNPLITKSQEGSTFVITNTALDAQLGYLLHHGKEKSVLLHSKYTKQDKVFWFDEVFESFKRNGSCKYSVLRSGPIIQASLNISCDKMLSEISSAENWLQRLGRLDRFGENKTVNSYITVTPQSLDIEGKLTSNCAKFLNQLNLYNSTKFWLSFLKDKLNDHEIININLLYKIYRDFYADEQARASIKQDLLLALKKSVELINKKIIDPISVPPKSKQKPDGIKISSNSLRGDNRFVQMAICRVNESLDIEFIDEYAYDEALKPNRALGNLTESVEKMRGYGEDNNNLVQYMRKKHHNIKLGSGYKQARNEWELIKGARSPESPIYLSYIPKDLECIGGRNAAHPQAVYYVTIDKQPVGAMSISQLKKYFQNTEVSD